MNNFQIKIINAFGLNLFKKKLHKSSKKLTKLPIFINRVIWTNLFIIWAAKRVVEKRDSPKNTTTHYLGLIYSDFFTSVLDRSSQHPSVQ